MKRRLTNQILAFEGGAEQRLALLVDGGHGAQPLRLEHPEQRRHEILFQEPIEVIKINGETRAQINNIRYSYLSHSQPNQT